MRIRLITIAGNKEVAVNVSTIDKNHLYTCGNTLAGTVFTDREEIDRVKRLGEKYYGWSQFKEIPE